MNSNDINQFPQFLNKAREKAVLGDYISSIKYYEILIKSIKTYTNNLKDNYLSNKWKELYEKIMTESSLIYKAYNFCKVFKENSIDEQFKKVEEQNLNSNKILMREFKIDHKRSYNFDTRKNKKDNNNNYNFVINNYVIEKKYKDDEFLNKDPDVWEDPENDPRFPGDELYYKRIKRNKSPIKFESNVVNYEELEKKRNYEKPWKVNTNNNTNKNNANNNNKNKKTNNNDKKNSDNNNNTCKSPFLLSRYPSDNGKGPDSDLISMLEREVLETNPNVNFDDIAELDTAKKTLQEAVILPLLLPNFFKGLRRPWKGVLLYGPPGTGKTLLAKALATQGKTTFFNVSATSFASKWRGESEKLVRLLFEMARFYAPSTIFIDEVDSVGTKRKDGDNEASRRVMAEMLVQMDGIASTNGNNNNANNDNQNNQNNNQNNNNQNNSDDNRPKNVMVLAATNHPWDLDDALRRRFEKRVYIPLPNKKGRKKMFEINLKDVVVEKNVNFDLLVKNTEGYSGADIANVCREAALMNMRRKIMNVNKDGNFDIMKMIEDVKFQNEIDAPITENDFLTAIKNISKSVGKNDLKKYDDWTKEFASK